MQTSGAQINKNVKFNPMSNQNITWNDVNWSKTRHYVRKLQHRIYKAKKDGNKKMMFPSKNLG
jgi:N-terminal domain of reverse transcriptase